MALIHLELYRRHTPDCPHAAKGNGYTKCTCPIWTDGFVNEERYRKSTGTRDWARAVKRAESWEQAVLNGTVDSVPALAKSEGMTVAAGIKNYLDDCRARKLAPLTLLSYEKSLGHFRSWRDAEGIAMLADVTLDDMTRFRVCRRTWPAGRMRAPVSAVDPEQGTRAPPGLLPVRLRSPVDGRTTRQAFAPRR